MNKRVARTIGIAAVFVPIVVAAMGSRPKMDEEAANLRIQPVAKVKLAAAQSPAAAGNRSGEELYKAVCAACHDAGVAGAPKTGNAAEWAPRIAAGLDALLKTAINGKGGMPPKGGSDATDEEMRRAVIYLANKAGGSFKE